jgi:hypothetical protein
MTDIVDGTQGDRLAAAALGLVGVPFRMHGRDPATGLDCVGVAVAALAGIGRQVSPPLDYRLRGGCLHRFDRWAAQCGLTAVPLRGMDVPGDVLLCAAGPQQFHVMIDAGPVLVHAHATLRRVVAHPRPSPWPVVRRWQLRKES